MVIKLLMPQKRYFNSYLSALKESKVDSANPAHWQREIDEFPANIQKQRQNELLKVSPKRTYWAILDNEYIGTGQIKLRRSARNALIKNNLYYDIRPKMRGKGHGTTLFTTANSGEKRIEGMARKKPE